MTLEVLLGLYCYLSRSRTTLGSYPTRRSTDLFPCVHGLKNPKTMKSTWVEPRSKKSRGLDHPGPTNSRSEGGITPGGQKCHQYLKVDLDMCFNVLEVGFHQIVQGMDPRCDLPHIRAITLSRFPGRLG